MRTRAVVFTLLTVHIALLAISAWLHSPVIDEVPHLPSGISHWQLGRFELYRVNPPLVRMVAAVPVMLAGAKTDWAHYVEGNGVRPIANVGNDFLYANGESVTWYYTLARWACIPFSIIGAVTCLRWASEVFGQVPGHLALGLWCFSPNILANAALITPDAGATALGVLCSFFFWKWLKQPSWNIAFLAGTTLGLAELTKTTWILLFGLWPAIWLCVALVRRHAPATIPPARQLAVILGVALYVLNLGYGFDGTFTRLGDFRFVSKALSHQGLNQPGESRVNRFDGTWLGSVPVPFPRQYVIGIDLQKRDFENRLWSYLRGQWQRGGWWYYYLYAMAIKVPLGTWMLVGMAVACWFAGRWKAMSVADEMALLVPPVTILLFVSSQTGFSHHLRYVLLIFPFLFIWVSRVAACSRQGPTWLKLAASVAVIWSVGSSLLYFPHSLSYFNELVGGPKNGHRHLDNSNTEWGQDLLLLRQWMASHPETGPVAIDVFTRCRPEQVGISHRTPTTAKGTSEPGSHPAARHAEESGKFGPWPGWHVIGVNLLHCRSRQYEYFLDFAPVDRIGYSMNVYCISPDEANRWRKKRGLPSVDENWMVTNAGFTRGT